MPPGILYPSGVSGQDEGAELDLEKIRADPAAIPVVTPAAQPATDESLALPPGYIVDSRRHGATILRGDFPELSRELSEVLRSFWLVYDDFYRGGGNLSIPARKLHEALRSQGWQETEFPRTVSVAGVEVQARTHKVDHFRAPAGRWPGIAVEVEWNNKDPFFARDLTAFEVLHLHGVISVGVIITRGESLAPLVATMGNDAEGKPIKRNYGASTIHWDKLIAMVNLGGGGTCPLLLIAIEQARVDRSTIPRGR